MVKDIQISGRILKLMSDKKITAYRLCKDLKIHSGLFSGMKDGKTRWQIEILMDIAEYFDVSLDSIVFGAEGILGSNGKGGRYGKIEEAKVKELKEENEKLKEELSKYKRIKIKLSDLVESPDSGKVEQRKKIKLSDLTDR